MSPRSGACSLTVAVMVSEPNFADEPTGNLDSRTSREILEMFSRLNGEEGITIMLVTHDAEVASHAGRVIHISDGLVVNGAYRAAAGGEA